MKRPLRWRWVAAALVAALVASGAGVLEAGPSSAMPGDPITTAEMPDQGLRDAINDELGQSPGDSFTQGDVAAITDLGASGRGITDLTGVEYLTGVQTLWLQSNPLGDTAAQYLASHATDLSNLTEIDLDGTNVGDVGAQAIAGNLTNLTRLGLESTDVGDVGAQAIAGNLTNLTTLYLGGTDVGDVGAQAIAGNLTNLTLLYLDLTDVGDVGAQAIAGNLTNLTSLHLAVTDVGDVGAQAIASNLTNVTYLNLGSTDVGDTGAMAIGDNLANLKHLILSRASIADVSPLASLSNLTSLSLPNQNLTAAPASVGDATANPVVDENGDPVVVSSTDPGFSYDSGSNTWSFSTPGNKTLEWSTTVTIGSASDVEFSGTITQEIGEHPGPLVVTPQAPEVTQASCVDGEVVGPQIDLATTEGLSYAIIGDVEPGATVAVVAQLDGDAVSIEDPSGDWVVSDHITAAMEITLDSVECTSTPTTVPGTSTTVSPATTSTTLPGTSTTVPPASTSTTLPGTSTTVPPATTPPTRPNPAAPAKPAAPVSGEPAYTG